MSIFKIANLIIIIYNDVYKISTEKVWRNKPTIASFLTNEFSKQNKMKMKIKEMQCEPNDKGNGRSTATK